MSVRLGTIVVTLRARWDRWRTPRIVEFDAGERWIYRRGRWVVLPPKPGDTANIIERYRRAGLL